MNDGCNIIFNIDPSAELDNCAIPFNIPRNALGNIIPWKSRVLLYSDSCRILSIQFLSVVNSSIIITSEKCELEQIKAGQIQPEDSIIELSSEAVDFYNHIGSHVYPLESYILLQNNPSTVLLLHEVISMVAPTSTVVLLGIPVEEEPSIKVPEPHDLPTSLPMASNDFDGSIIPWRPTEASRGQFKNTDITVAWGRKDRGDFLVDITYKYIEDGGQLLNIPWKQMQSVHLEVEVSWEDCKNVCYYHVSVPWRYLWHRDQERNVRWRNFDTLDRLYDIPWYHPEAKDISSIAAWDIFTHNDIEYTHPWRSPLHGDTKFNKDVEFEIPWGPIDLLNICCESYIPPPPCYPIVFNMTEPVIPYICQGVVLSIGPIYTNSLTKYCPYQHTTSGNRDSTTDPSELDRLVLKPKDEYDMINTVIVQFLPLNPQNPIIDVTSISISTDKDSYLWSFNISISKDDASEEVIQALRPKVANGEPLYTNILININQHYWVCTVDGYSESRSFGKKIWNITGRSPSMLLGSPQNKKFTYTYITENDAAIAGQSIISKILDGSALGSINDSKWRADFTAYNGNREQKVVHTGFDPSTADWGFRSGSITWQDSTQIDAIKSLTDSIGAFIITEPNSVGAGKGEVNAEDYQKLYIRPRYNYPPWLWATKWDVDSPYCKMISTELAVEVERSYERKAEYNAVMVMGTIKTEQTDTPGATEKGFPVVELFRKEVGKGFRVYAPDIVDERLQTVMACAEAGRPILCETGFWLKHTLRLYSLRFPDSEDKTIPPLCWPGDLIKVQEGNSRGGIEVDWFGDVESVQIDVTVNNNVAYVTQTLGLNQYADV